MTGQRRAGIRVSREEAADWLGRSLRTIDRMIERGDLMVDREPAGTRHRVWVWLDSGASVDASHDAPEDDTGSESMTVQVARLEERVRSLQGLIEQQREQIVQAEWRFQELMQRFEREQELASAVTRMLPAGEERKAESPRRRTWWRFGRG